MRKKRARRSRCGLRSTHSNTCGAGGESARFDGNTGRHYHIRCVACGRVNDLPISVDRRLEEEAGRAMNYQVVSHQVEVLGVCPLCQTVQN